MKTHATSAQRQRILAYLKKYGSITTPESRFKLDIPHPAGRINELRKKGFNIVTVMVRDHNPGGTDHCFAKYFLKNTQIKEAR